MPCKMYLQNSVIRRILVLINTHKISLYGFVPHEKDLKPYISAPYSITEPTIVSKSLVYVL